MDRVSGIEGEDHMGGIVDVQLDKVVVIVVGVENQRTAVECSQIDENVIDEETAQSDFVGQGE